MSHPNTGQSDLHPGDEDRAEQDRPEAFTCPRAACLDAYYDGELAADASAEVESHVDTCAECTAHLRELRRVTRLLDAGPRPPHLSQIALHRIHAAVEAEVEADASDAARPERLIPLFRKLTAAAAIIIAGASAVMYMQPPRTGSGVAPGGTTTASWEQAAVAPGHSVTPGQGANRPDQVVEWIVDDLSPAKGAAPATRPAASDQVP